jgi:hypothetical protein
MATRSHSDSTSLRMCEDRKTVWPPSRASATQRRNSRSISGSSPLVGSSSSSRSDRVQGEALDQLVAVRGVHPALHAPEQMKRLRAGQRRPEAGLAGHVGQPAVSVDRLPLAVQAEDLRPARRRPSQPEVETGQGGHIAVPFGEALGTDGRRIHGVSRRR